MAVCFKPKGVNNCTGVFSGASSYISNRRSRYMLPAGMVFFLWYLMSLSSIMLG